MKRFYKTSACLFLWTLLSNQRSRGITIRSIFTLNIGKFGTANIISPAPLTEHKKSLFRTKHFNFGKATDYRISVAFF